MWHVLVNEHTTCQNRDMALKSTGEATPVTIGWRSPGMKPVVVDAVPYGCVVGENLRRLRQERRWTQHELARHLQRNALGWRRNQVAAVEAGNRATMDYGTVLTLAAALGVEPAKLFAGDGHMFLTPGSVQSREGHRAVLAGTSAADLPLDQTVRIIDPSSLQLRHEDAMAQAGRDSDEALAKRLGAPTARVMATARELFDGLTLTQERDRRVDVLAEEAGEEMSIGEKQAHRGHITRELSALIEAALKKGE